MELIQAKDRTVLITQDGSPTFQMKGAKETYHSRHGAITESQYVFITQGLDYWCKKNPNTPCRIFEMGMGTGLNAYLTAIYVKKNAPLDILYHTVEAYPLPVEEWVQLKLHQQFLSAEMPFSITEMYAASWGTEVALSPTFSIVKQEAVFQQFHTADLYDVLFYDAFGAHVQPELWAAEMMQKCFDLLRPGGVWVSYCAKGSVRRALLATGFEVVRLPGPPGKREMLRAIKVV